MIFNKLGKVKQTNSFRYRMRFHPQLWTSILIGQKQRDYNWFIEIIFLKEINNKYILILADGTWITSR